MQGFVTDTTVDIYSSDPAGVKERPANGYYANGVDVGYTAPAKWWNWLFNKLTNLLGLSFIDVHDINAELSNVLTEASVVPNVDDTHQLSEAINTVCYAQDMAYDDETVTEEIGGVMVAHPKNRPYVVGHTVYYPDTELL